DRGAPAVPATVRIHCQRPSEQFLRRFPVSIEAARERAEPYLADPFEIVRAPGSPDFGIDAADALDGARDFRDGGFATYPAIGAWLGERTQIVRQAREHVAAIAPEILLGVREAVIRAHRNLVGRGNCLVERQGGFAQLVALARSLFGRHREAHRVAIVKAQLRRALDSAIGSGHLGGASRMPSGGYVN